VRREIARALARGIRVIPVLVGGAAMPRARDLPADIAPLAEREALTERSISISSLLTDPIRWAVLAAIALALTARDTALSRRAVLSLAAVTAGAALAGQIATQLVHVLLGPGPLTFPVGRIFFWTTFVPLVVAGVEGARRSRPARAAPPPASHALN
jgi:hypothetical protein